MVLILEIGLTQIKSYVGTLSAQVALKYCSDTWESCTQRYRQTSPETRQPFIMIFVCWQVNRQLGIVPLAYTCKRIP